MLLLVVYQCVCVYFFPLMCHDKWHFATAMFVTHVRIPHFLNAKIDFVHHYKLNTHRSWKTIPSNVAVVFFYLLSLPHLVMTNRQHNFKKTKLNTESHQSALHTCHSHCHFNGNRFVIHNSNSRRHRRFFFYFFAWIVSPFFVVVYNTRSLIDRERS